MKLLVFGKRKVQDYIQGTLTTNVTKITIWHLLSFPLQSLKGLFGFLKSP